MPADNIAALLGRSSLPGSIKAVLKAEAASTRASAVKRALRRQPAGLVSRLALLIEKASLHTGLPPGDILFAAGFDPKDKAPGRLEAALAELAAVNRLADLDFSGISLLPRSACRGADLSAHKDGRQHFFEVRCLNLSEKSPLEYLYSGAEPHPEAAAYLREKYLKKIPQALCSSKKTAGSLAGVIIIISPLRGGLNEKTLAALTAQIPLKPNTTLIVS
jgi:hypothetical protein